MDVRTEIEAVLEKSRVGVLGRAEAIGLPLQRLASQLVVDRESAHSWSTRQVAERRSAFDTWSAERLAGALGEDVGTAVLDLAARLYKRHSATLPFWSVFVGHGPELATWSTNGEHPSFDEDPIRWIAERMVLPAVRAYLGSLDSVAEPSKAALRRISDGLLRAARDTEWHVRSSIPVAGLDTDADVVEAGHLRVRRLTASEQGTIAERTFTATSSYVPGDLPSHSIELEHSMERDRQPTSGEVARSAIAAFFLHGYELAGAGLTAVGVQPDWLCPFTWNEPTPLPKRIRNSRLVSQEQLLEISHTAAHLDGQKVATPTSRQELALHRFVSGCSRDDPIDALLDSVFALEALLLPEDQGALAYRFRLHGALYLSDDVQQSRPTTWDQLKALYKFRSRAVHGSKYPTLAEARDHSVIARRLASVGLLRAVHRGFPAEADFRDLALGT